jgi:hypothetical protein
MGKSEDAYALSKLRENPSQLQLISHEVLLGVLLGTRIAFNEPA